MKVEFNDFVVKIKAQYKTEKENRTEKFLYHLLGVYADAQKTAIREQKFAIAQAYNKEIEGIRDAIHHEKTAREETEKKSHEETEEHIGKKILVEDEAEYEAVINKLDNQGFRWNAGEKAKEWSPKERFPYFIRIATGKKLLWGFCGPNENLISAIDFIEGEKGKEERQLNKDTPMTTLQLSEWLAKGHGQAKFSDSRVIFLGFSFDEGEEDEAINEDIRIRPWGTDQWVKPTLGIYERDCRK